MNEVKLAGEIKTDVRIDYVGERGTAKCSFKLAVIGYNDREELFPIVCWADIAEAMANTYSKGDEVAVLGRLTQNKWKDKQTGEWRERIEVTAQSVTPVNPSMGEEVTPDDDNPFDGDPPF